MPSRGRTLLARATALRRLHVARLPIASIARFHKESRQSFLRRPLPAAGRLAVLS